MGPYFSSNMQITSAWKISILQVEDMISFDASVPPLFYSVSFCQTHSASTKHCTTKTNRKHLISISHYLKVKQCIRTNKYSNSVNSYSASNIGVQKMSYILWFIIISSQAINLPLNNKQSLIYKYYLHLNTSTSVFQFQYFWHHSEM